MQPSDFPKVFAALTGAAPFPWQSALYVDFISGRFHSLVNLPTGLGKTSIVVIWLCALATKPQDTPRRLIYVVNRRTVVDQTTSEVEKWCKNLEAAGIASSLFPLCAVPLAPGDSPLALSTLRGQFADNRAWSADPARPAVIVGTVDMIGSRLLFNGYGSGFKVRPHHAGFLGQDALLVHDEAHLEPAFQRLLESIVAQQVADRDPRPLRLIALSATNRAGADSQSFALTAADLADATVRQRFHAAKKPALHPIADEKKELATNLVDLALARRESGRAILIFARSVEVVHRVAAELEKAKLPNKPVTLTGTLRGWERDCLAKNPVFQRFLSSDSRVPISEPIPIGTVYLVATSAGEVGVNLSGDDLVCDLSTFESMAQRLGRVNRFGKLANSTIDIVHPHAFDYEASPEKQQGKDHVEIARERTLALFQQLEKNGDSSPAALSALDPAARSAAFSPEPAILPATDILFDAWSLTTIRDRLPGRPPVEPYLHGVAEWEPPQTQVAWRTEVEVITDLDDTTSLQELYPPDELLADYPLRPHEFLRDRSARVLEQLKKLAAHPHAETLPVWLVEQDGQVTVLTLAELLSRRDAEEALHHRTLLLSPSAGGLRSDGSLDGDAPPSEPVEKDIADLMPAGSPRLRQRIWSDGPASSLDMSAGFRLIRPPIDTRPVLESSDGETGPVNDSEQDTATRTGRYWYWFESTQALDGANLHYAQASVLLEVHTKDVETLARSIAEKLRLSADLVHALSLAARFHDAGKDRSGWQKGIGNPTPAVPLAKAGRRLRPRETGDRYRHEFGSLLDVVAHADFLALPEASQDLVLHLIAAHHGRARPHFPTDEIADPAATLAEVQAQAGEVPLRFARLQRRFGRWGLAYLESILRAADYAASATPSSTLEDSK